MATPRQPANRPASALSFHGATSTFAENIRCSTIRGDEPVPDEPNQVYQDEPLYERTTPTLDAHPRFSVRALGSSLPLPQFPVRQSLEVEAAIGRPRLTVSPSFDCLPTSRHLPETRHAERARSATFPAGERGELPKRRPKRTEDQRIAYLRNDPYVAHFDAYRAFCAICNKWIRLRPNSTYCSIPWDAHRRSCLARRDSIEKARKAYLDDERRSHRSSNIVRDIGIVQDGRAFCDICRSWIPIHLDGESHAQNAWAHHRHACQHSQGDESVALPPLLRGSVAGHPYARQAQPLPSIGSVLNPSAKSSAGFLVGSRRADAERRRLTFTADPLIGEIEPHRAFCRLCRHWVQLRRDSTYCIYPWMQHRANCVRRRNPDGLGLASIGNHSVPHLGGYTSSDTMSEFVTAGSSEENFVGRLVRCDTRSENTDTSASSDSPLTAISRHRYQYEVPRSDGTTGNIGMGIEDGVRNFSGQPNARDRRLQRDSPPPRAPLMDLDSSEGRARFVASSVYHLRTTTYEAHDDLSINSLVSYLNLAMPVDKHEDFDVREVRNILLARDDLTVHNDVVRARSGN